MSNEIQKEQMLRTLRDTMKRQYRYGATSYVKKEGEKYVAMKHQYGYDDPDDLLRKLYLEYSGKCVPDDFFGDSVEQGIIDKFYWLYDAVRQQINHDRFIEIHIVPDLTDESYVFIECNDYKLYSVLKYAWHNWDSVEDLKEEMWSAYVKIRRALEEMRERDETFFLLEMNHLREVAKMVKVVDEVCKFETLSNKKKTEVLNMAAELVCEHINWGHYVDIMEQAMGQALDDLCTEEM